MSTLKNRLLQLLEQDQLRKVIQILLAGDVPLPARTRKGLRELSATDDLSAVAGEQRQKLKAELRRLIEDLFAEDEAPPAAAPPPASSPAPAREAGPKSSREGGILKRNWDRLGDLFSSGSKGSRPQHSKTTREEDFDGPPPARRIPTETPKRSSRPKSSAKKPKAEPQAAPQPDPATPAAPAPAASAPTNTNSPDSPFQKGKLLYVVPPRMPLEEISACRIRIAPDQLRDADLQMGLSEDELANAQSEGIRMTQVMRVELLNHPTDADNFRISCRNNLEQPVFPFTVSEWTFDVVPQRPGKYALLVRVTARINYAGAERSFDLVVLNRAVEVVAGAGEVVELEESTQPIPDNDWDESDIRFVDQALQNNQIARAIERLANFIQDKDRELHIALLLQQARWNDNSNRLEEGRIATADWDLMNSQVRYAIARFHQQIQELDFAQDQSEALAAARADLNDKE